MKERCGRITASELGSLVSASGKIIDGNLSYIRSKRWERERGFALPVSSKAMEMGNQVEPEIFEWAKANLPECQKEEFFYSKDLEAIPFWVPEDMPYFGASPDAFNGSHSIVLEFKALVGNETAEFFMDHHTDYAEKKARVVKEHGEQVFGLFLSDPRVETVCLIKYYPQRDDIDQDTDSPLAPWRGIVFYFHRKDYEASLAAIRERTALVNAMIDSGLNPAEFKSGTWFVKDGKLAKV